MMGSNGLIELAAPLTDEERRDFEVHIRGLYGSALAVQVKSVLELIRMSKNVRGLHCGFAVRATRVVNDPLFWYFFAYLDPKTMRFADPTFLVPASFVHDHASPTRAGAFWRFDVQASMEPKSNDQWSPYRITIRDLGKKALSTMREQAKVASKTTPPHPLPPPSGEGRVVTLLDNQDLIWLRKR